MTTLTRETLGPLGPAMAEWVMAWYPREGCGLIVEEAGALRVVPCENRQDAARQRSPEMYLRDGTTAYLIDPMDYYAHYDEGRLRAIFHSHTDVGTAYGAYFSAEDVLVALGGDTEGEPVLPGVDYVVLSARADGVDDMKLFHWDEQRRAFEEIT